MEEISTKLICTSARGFLGHQRQTRDMIKGAFCMLMPILSSPGSNGSSNGSRADTSGFELLGSLIGAFTMLVLILGVAIDAQSKPG